MDTHTTTEKDLSEVFGLDELSETERETYLAEVGTTLFESALLTFMLTLSEGERTDFEAFLSTAGEGSELMEKLVEAYPGFADELNAEIVRFRAEAVKLLDPESNN